jgi:type II secretory pathway pseudopilin PulG
MEYKTLNNLFSGRFLHPANQKGLTYLELIIVVLIISIGIFTVMLIVNPAESRAKARDQKRLSDVQRLETAVLEFRQDNARYPEQLSELVPEYITHIPQDPLNEGVYVYEYAYTNFGYEINAVLEHYFEYSENDGGNDPTRYEVGNDLSII